jgi:hypothetical protein
VPVQSTECRYSSYIASAVLGQFQDYLLFLVSERSEAKDNCTTVVIRICILVGYWWLYAVLIISNSAISFY